MYAPMLEKERRERREREGGGETKRGGKERERERERERGRLTLSLEGWVRESSRGLDGGGGLPTSEDRLGFLATPGYRRAKTVYVSEHKQVLNLY